MICILSVASRLFVFMFLIAMQMSEINGSNRILLNIKVPPKVNHCNVTCIYHGHPLPFSSNYCILPDTCARQFFNLIITSSVDIDSKKTTDSNKADCVRKFFTIKKPKNTLWFTLSRLPANRASKQYWKIEKLAPSDMPAEIPMHSSVIVQMSSSFVDHLEQPIANSLLITRLPTIVLKDSLIQEEVNEVLNGRAVCMPDLYIHCSLPITEKTKNGNLVVSQFEER